MELGPKLTRATPPSEESGEAEYWISDVHPIEDGHGFDISDGAKQDVVQFIYADAAEAERAREAMFQVLKKAVGVAPA